MSAQLPLYVGDEVTAYALIDEPDLAIVSAYRWHLSPQGYPVCYLPSGTRRALLLSRLLMSDPADAEVDHANGDRLDNRRANLRICTHSENMQNRKVHRNSKTGLRSVFWVAAKNAWRVRPTLNGRKIHLGYFHDVSEADRVAREWRRLNMPFAVEGR